MWEFSMREVMIFAGACAMIMIGAGPVTAQAVFMTAPSAPAMAEVAMGAAAAADAVPPTPRSPVTDVAVRAPRRGSD
jgi:hypothetical protein